MKYIKKCSRRSGKHLCDGIMAHRRVSNQVLKDKDDLDRQIKKENSTGGEDCRYLTKNSNKWVVYPRSKE